MPDKGFEIKLADSEMLALIQDRRDRDILQPPSAKDAAATNGEPPAKTPRKATAAVDRQLQAAVKYLNTELAKAQ